MCASLWEQFPSKHSYHSHALLVHRHTRLWWSLPQWKRLSPSPAYAVQFTVQLLSTVPPSPWEHFCATRLLSSALSPHCFFTTRLFTLSVAPLHLDLLSFPFRNLFMGSQKLVYSFFSLTYPQKGSACKLLDANSPQAQHISDSLPFLHLQLPRTFTEEDG